MATHTRSSLRIWIVILSLIIIHAEEPESQRQQAHTTNNMPVHTMLAYDCKEPRNIQDTGYELDAGCTAPSQQHLATMNVTYQLVQ